MLNSFPSPALPHNYMSELLWCYVQSGTDEMSIQMLWLDKKSLLLTSGASTCIQMSQLYRHISRQRPWGILEHFIVHILASTATMCLIRSVILLE